MKKYFFPLLRTMCPVKIYQEPMPALQIRAGQRSITASLRFLTTHIYHVMIIVTVDFSKKSFFILFLFPRNSFERSWTCFLGI